MTEALVDVDGAEIWTVTTGSGPLPVVLCHGGPGLSDNLGPVAQMIEDVALVHRYDQRGGGRSSREPPFSVARFVEDLEALRRYWGHELWVVGGHLWGGWLALFYAIEHPDRVSAIVTISTPPPQDPGWRAAFRREREARLSADERAFLADVADRRVAGETVSPEDELRRIHLMWRTDFANPDAAPDFDREPLFLFPTNLEVNSALVEDVDRLALEGDIMSDVGLLGCPGLFLHGAGDPRPSARDVVEILPKGELVDLSGAGHLPWYEKYEAVRDVLREFLARLPDP